MVSEINCSATVSGPQNAPMIAQFNHSFNYFFFHFSKNSLYLITTQQLIKTMLKRAYPCPPKPCSKQHKHKQAQTLITFPSAQTTQNRQKPRQKNAHPKTPKNHPKKPPIPSIFDPKNAPRYPPITTKSALSLCFPLRRHFCASGALPSRHPAKIRPTTGLP